jgi:hypothetical protein
MARAPTKTKTKTVADPRPRCPSCGNELRFSCPVEGRTEAMLGVCTRPGCGEWVAVVAGTRSDGRWLIVGRVARWAWPPVAPPVQPPAP